MPFSVNAHYLLPQCALSHQLMRIIDSVNAHYGFQSCAWPFPFISINVSGRPEKELRILVTKLATKNNKSKGC